MTTPRTTQGGSGRPPFRRGGRRRRECFCKSTTVDYKDVSSIRRFITDRGRIEAGKKSGNCAKCQRNLTTAIKRARHLALLPYAPEHLRVTGSVATSNKVSEDEEETVDAEATESTEKTESKTEDAPAAEAADKPEAVEESETEETATEETEAVEEAATEETEAEEPAEEETEAATEDVSTDETPEAEVAEEAPEAEEASTDEEDK
jgi:small subunit ribosomal protein S18